MAHAGEILNDTYRLDAMLGAGGSGETWRATDAVTGRQVAIKLVSDEDLGRLLLREADLSHLLRHNNVVQFQEGGTTSDGRTFLVHEFVEGPSLADIISASAPLPPAQTVAILRPLLDALAAIHARMILHRDIKPSNIVVSPERGPVLLDFGAAGILKHLPSSAPRTVIGEVAGSPLYMSPEQMFGARQGPPADLYALALVALEMDTGSPPPGGKNLFDLVRERALEAPDLSGASRQLRPFLEACLKPRPEDRPASAREATRYLPDQPAPASVSPARGRVALRAAVALGIVFLVATGGFAAFFAFQRPTADPSAGVVVEPRAISNIDATTLRSLGLIAGGFAICVSGLVLVRMFHARSDDTRTNLRYTATEAINDPYDADWLSRTIFVQIEEYQKIARSTGDRLLTLTLVKLARDMVSADNLADQHRAMGMFIELHDKLSARLTPWWLNYEKLVGRALSAFSLVTGAVAVIQGLRGLF